MPIPFPSPVRRLASGLVFAAATAAVALWLWSCLCRFPVHGWNAIRLAPSFMWWAGVTPYPGPSAGPVTTWIYGPLPLILQWPATLMGGATSALLAAGVINLLLAVAPLAVAIRAQAAPATSRQTRLAALLLTLACWPAVNLIFCQAGNAAIACGLLAGAVVAGAAPRDSARLWTAAALAALALWSRQTELGPVLGQIAYLGLRHGRRAALTQTLRAAAAGGFFGLVFGGVFGAEGLIYNMFVIPAALPFVTFADKVKSLVYTGDIAAYLLAYLIVPAVVVGVRVRRFLHRDHPALAPVLVFAWSVPFDLAGFFTVGGNVNSFHAAVYLLPAAALWLVERSQRAGAWSGAVPVGLALALALQGMPLGPLPMKPQLTGLRQGAALARQLPGQIYFPWNPLLTYFSDGRFYHVEDGLITRSIAGRPVPPAVVKSGLPPALCVVAYHRYAIESFVRALIPPNARRDAFGEWILFSWPPPAARATP
ncbi:MAG TPA: hypothetical protein VLT83_14225 [Opitutaceae bacterium]|nr:hypothetical protein [Opitutaceae bacterium]